jgi:hypothetical protein
LEGVARVVDVAGEGGGIGSAEIEGDRLQIEAVGFRGGDRRRRLAMATSCRSGGGLSGLKDNIPQRDRLLAGNGNGTAGELKLAGPGRRWRRI